MRTFTPITQRSLVKLISVRFFVSVSKEPVSYWYTFIYLKRGLKCQIISCFNKQRCIMMESSVGDKKKQVNITKMRENMTDLPDVAKL